jgi:hypothetical protein
MTRIGQGRAALVGAALGVAAALVPALFMWGFTVDDALIPVRYARHLMAGEGYRFNVGGPVTDGVTPLPWAPLLAPLARGEALDVLARAKCIDLGAWLVGAAAWGAAVAGASARAWQKAVAFACLALSVPVAAHAVSGLETGVATSLATCGAVLGARRPYAAAALAGLAAAFRPEMAPWAVILASGLARAADGRALRVAGAAAIALAPFAACALLRLALFGQLAPLAVQAKPGLLEEGARYALASVLVSGGPILALSPLALRRAPAAAAIAVAGFVQFVVIAAVGGDWMAYARLAAPVVPSLLLAAVQAAPAGMPFAVRAALALTLEGYYALAQAPAGRRVMADRAALAAAARPLFADARRIASLDVGWPSAASEAAIVDLAGVTDPEVAALPGGHTSKRVDPAFLLTRQPDVLLLLARRGVDATHLDEWGRAEYRGIAEQRLARSEVIERAFSPRAFLSLGVRGEGYVVLIRAR